MAVSPAAGAATPPGRLSPAGRQRKDTCLCLKHLLQEDTNAVETREKVLSYLEDGSGCEVEHLRVLSSRSLEGRRCLRRDGAAMPAGASACAKGAALATKARGGAQAKGSVLRTMFDVRLKGPVSLDVGEIVILLTPRFNPY